ncbi:MAG: PCMD domain-containing protein [Bacteroidales bacterium]
MKYMHVLLLPLLVMALSQCVKVTELDDYASVKSCAITSFTPQTVVFDTPVVEESNILIPMKYGKYEFPVTVTLDIVTEQKIDKILGLDENNTLTFNSPETVRKFHLVALSGVPHAYTVSIEVADLSEEASVTDARLITYTPPHILLSGELDIDVVASQVILYVLEGQEFPLHATFGLSLSPGASVEGLEEASGYYTVAFPSCDTPVPFTVLAESGRKETWSLLAARVVLATDPAQTEPGVWGRLQPQEPIALLLDTTGPQIMEWVKEPARSLFTAFLKDYGTPFPWEAKLSYSQGPYVIVLDRKESNNFQITKWGQQDTLYLADKLTRTARSWIFSWEKWLNTAHNVTSFQILEYTSQRQEIILNTPAIDTLTAKITIPFREGKDFPLDITAYRVEVSENAAANLSGTLSFATYKDAVPFRITSESGLERTWNIVLAPWFQTEAEVLDFRVVSYRSASNLVTLKNKQAVVNPSDSTVRLVLKAGYDFPFVIENYILEISPKAVLQENYANGMVFETIEDRLPLTLVAESGDVKEWKLVLEDERTEVTEALVLDYRIHDYSGTTLTDNNLVLRTTPDLDTAARTITFTIEDWSNKMPLTVNGTVHISKNAQLSGGITSLQHTLLFHTPDEEYRFEVISESGTNRTQWTIRLEDRSKARLNQANIVDFITGPPSSGFTFDYKYLEVDKAAITLLVAERPSGQAVLTIKAALVLSEGAVLYDGLLAGAPLELSFDKPYSFTVMAEDETFKEWQIQLIHAPQVPNSRFEEWGVVNKIFNILPSNGKGWTSGNNSQISGTFRDTGPDGSYAVKLLTVLKTVDLGLVRITSLAAGTLLLGSFNFSINTEAIMNPTSMTDFGIPFKADDNPVGFEIDYNYKAGAQMVQTEPYVGLMGIPAFRDPRKIPGKDMASIIVELHESTPGRFDYYKNYEKTIIAGYHLYTDGTPGWRRERFIFAKTPGKEHVGMTHLVVRCSSSQNGHFYMGADGSTLLLDNFHLLYYIPSENAVLLK